MIRIVRTNSEHPDFIRLVQCLDAELVDIDGDEHAFYAQFNKIDMIKHAVVIYQEGQPVGCGAIKEYDAASMEVKRMYTSPESRGKGIASRILVELETWTVEMSYRRCILETGKRQPDAIALYRKNGYFLIPNYGQYEGLENSVCFEKVVSSDTTGR